MCTLGRDPVIRSDPSPSPTPCTGRTIIATRTPILTPLGPTISDTHQISNYGYVKRATVALIEAKICAHLRTRIAQTFHYD